jgi:hypothetical protein
MATDSGTTVMLLLGTGVLWVGAVSIAPILVAFGRHQLAVVVGALTIVLPVVMGLAVAGAGTHADGEWQQGAMIGWAVGVYAAVALALGSLAMILNWSGRLSRPVQLAARDPD